MLSELKTLHPYLYKRVRIKAVTNVALGLTLVFTDYVNVQTPNAHRTQLYELLPFTVWGIIFIIIGVGMFYGLYKGERTYKISRAFIGAGFVYNLLWLVALLVTVFTDSPATASILILWSYWTYNHYLLYTDTGWVGAIILRDLEQKEAKDG